MSLRPTASGDRVGGGVTFAMQGPNIVDNISMVQFERNIARAVDQERRRAI